MTAVQMMFDHIGFQTVHAIRFAGRLVVFIGLIILGFYQSE